MTYAIESHYKLPKRRKAKAVPDAIAAAMRAYQEAFKAVYGVTPTLTFNKATRFISDGKTSCSTKRLKELTRMLRQRIG